MSRLTHLDEQGNANMVDVSEKQITSRKPLLMQKFKCCRKLCNLLLRVGIRKGMF